jgi:hypothetical protein
MKRLEQVILIVTFFGFSWLAMQAIHEFGHVVGAWTTGAEIIKVALHPCIISRTDIGYNPNPLVVVWAGPIIGAALPLLVFLVAKTYHFSAIYLFRFFAGFCLVANGYYIALCPAKDGADTAVMMLHGSPRWVMILFGLITAPLGLYLWHRQGLYFGLGEANGKVNRRAAIVSASLFVAIAGVELIINSK